MTPDVGSQYRQHLSTDDRAIVARVGEAGDLERVLAHPDLEAAVFGSPLEIGTSGALPTPSPFLAFAVAIHRTAARLEHARFVQERWAPRQRIPVFDVAPLRSLLADPLRRYFLVELLASYTRVSSGVTWTRTARGWRRRRFSELDPVRLAELLEVVEAAQRPGVYRRLGDLALFLTGVFPDRGAGGGPDAISATRLLRAAGLAPSLAEALAGPALLEHLGARWYRLAASSVTAAGLPVTASLSVAATIGERFADAGRVLNVVADDYLFPLRGQWFGIA